MTEFKLNDKEQENLLKSIEALHFLLDGADEINRTYHFSLSGIGQVSKITLIGIKNGQKIEVNKDITDYDSW